MYKNSEPNECPANISGTRSTIVGGIDKELTSQPKVYFSDTGNSKGFSGVQLFENAIANQLAHLGELNYFEKSRSIKIGFILDGKTACEMKESLTPQHLKLLKHHAKKRGSKIYIL